MESCSCYNEWLRYWMCLFSFLFADIFTEMCCISSFHYSIGTMLIMSHLVQNSFTYKGQNYLIVWRTTVLWIDQTQNPYTVPSLTSHTDTELYIKEDTNTMKPVLSVSFIRTLSTVTTHNNTEHFWKLPVVWGWRLWHWKLSYCKW